MFTNVVSPSAPAFGLRVFLAAVFLVVGFADLGLDTNVVFKVFSFSSPYSFEESESELLLSESEEASVSMLLK